MLTAGRQRPEEPLPREREADGPRGAGRGRTCPLFVPDFTGKPLKVFTQSGVE